jgi:histidinol-phosphatase (PHP family)
MLLSSFHGGHSKFSGGESEVREIANAAASQGFVAFGFTEHFQTPPMALNPDMALQGQLEVFGDYVSDVLAAKQEHTFLLLSAELEYIRGAEAWTREQTARWPFDYLLGSVHYVRIGDSDILVDWTRDRIDDALRLIGGAKRLQLAYYEEVLDLLSWGLVNVIGHLDLIKMLLTPEEAVPTPAIAAAVRTLLNAIRDAGAAIDVNARGLIKPCASIYPADWILREAKRIGVPVTLGDDSHRTADVGLNLNKAVEAISRAGYKNVWLVRPGGELEPTPLPLV